jgi:hypothetical protein
LKVPNKDQVAGLTKDLRARSKVPGMRKFASTTASQYYYLLAPIMLFYEAANILVFFSTSFKTLKKTFF